MLKVDRKSTITLFKSMVFAVLIAVSWPGVAQEIPKSGAELAALEMERVNINHADAETIARVLVGIGMSRAEAIVTYREEFGNFTSLEELMMVKGVGEITLKNNDARISFD
jgi:competence protein ComEA